MSSLMAKVVVVVGGSSGMGLATARAAVSGGAEVTIVGRDPERLAGAASMLGGGVRSFSFDASNEDDVEAMFAQLEVVDHVVSFVGEQPEAALDATTHQQLQRAVDARIWSARNLCASAAPRMRSGGSFTFCSGVSAWRPRTRRSFGAVATGGVEAFARAMAVELAPLRVNTICPGSFDTPVLDRAFGDRKDDVLAPYLAGLPLGRLGRPEELAHAAMFLMTNGYVTGTVLHIDGGSLLI